MDIRIKIGKRLKELRNEKGLSQEEIEEIEYEKASLDNESIDDIFSKYCDVQY